MSKTITPSGFYERRGSTPKGTWATKAFVHLVSVAFHL